MRKKWEIYSSRDGKAYGVRGSACRASAVLQLPAPRTATTFPAVWVVLTRSSKYNSRDTNLDGLLLPRAPSLQPGISASERGCGRRIVVSVTPVWTTGQDLVLKAQTKIKGNTS